jgi:acetyltransferase-like isoleucine patch superfamily enzyme
MRRLEAHEVSGNSMQLWWKVKNPLRIAFNFILIYAARFLPSTAAKNFLYRVCGAKIGKGATFGLGATIDIFYPELLSVGDDALIGFNTVILCHEFLQGSFRLGKVEIGSRVMLGANCTVLPGVKIGDGAWVSAMSLVNRDIPPGEKWGGVPAKRLK